MLTLTQGHLHSERRASLVILKVMSGVMKRHLHPSGLGETKGEDQMLRIGQRVALECQESNQRKSS